MRPTHDARPSVAAEIVEVIAQFDELIGGVGGPGSAQKCVLVDLQAGGAGVIAAAGPAFLWLCRWLIN